MPFCHKERFEIDFFGELPDSYKEVIDAYTARCFEALKERAEQPFVQEFLNECSKKVDVLPALPLCAVLHEPNTSFPDLPKAGSIKELEDMIILFKKPKEKEMLPAEIVNPPSHCDAFEIKMAYARLIEIALLYAKDPPGLGKSDNGSTPTPTPAEGSKDEADTPTPVPNEQVGDKPNFKLNETKGTGAITFSQAMLMFPPS